MTAITTGGDKGWRLALRHAPGDVAQNELFTPRVTQTRVRDKGNIDLNGTADLFDFEL